MSEEIQEQISAFIDDELSAEESAFLVRRLESDSAARTQLLRYAAIGSALRGELLHGDSSVLRRRIQASLSGDGALDDAPAHRKRHSSLMRTAAGFGVAATVAAVALIGLRSLNDPASDSARLVRGGAVPVDEWIEPASYVVPQETPELRLVSPPIRLTNYLMQHGNYASILSRASVHSNVVGVHEPEMVSGNLPDDGAPE